MDTQNHHIFKGAVIFNVSNVQEKCGMRNHLEEKPLKVLKVS